MEERLQVGMPFHSKYPLIRNLLREGYRQRANGSSAAVYKSGVYIISQFPKEPKYKIGMAGNSYSRLRNGYNLCFSEHKSFRLHYFVEVPGTAKQRKTFETIALSRFRLDDQQQIIPNTFQSNEWVLKNDKAELDRNFLEVLNNSDDWARVYSFSQTGYKCVDRVNAGVRRQLLPADLNPAIDERANCKVDIERKKRNKPHRKAELKRESDERRRAKERNRKIKKANEMREALRFFRRNEAQFMNPLETAIRNSLVGAPRPRETARAKRLRLRRRRT